MNDFGDQARGLRPSMARLAVTALIGTAIEWYDFFIYATAAALVFNKLFFPATDPTVGTLLAFGAFAAGFVARPLGSVLFGHLGDRIGRRNTLSITLAMMGSATVLIGFLPTYATAGIWAPILLVVLRIVQGISAGGEMGGAVLIGMEHAPKQRRGLMGSWAGAGAPAGVMFATLAFLALSPLGPDAFLSWGWRIPFLASALVVCVGLFVRLRLVEPPEFAEAEATGAKIRLPIVEVLRSYWRQVLLSGGMSLGLNTTTYLLATFLLYYWTVRLGLPREQFLIATVVGTFAMVVGEPLFAALSDRVGRRVVMLGGAGFTALFAFAWFPLLEMTDPLLTTIMLVVAFVGAAPLAGPMGAGIAELFSTQVRYSGSSAGYQLGATIGGGLAPVLATSFLLTGGTMAVSAYVFVAATISLGCVFLLREVVPGKAAGPATTTAA
jgi:MHS family shikimate/dehydroshikimate transporter-like MFS transporter